MIHASDQDNPPENPHREPHPTTSATDPFVILAVSFVALLLISNIAATKLFGLTFGPAHLIFDGGAILFPFTYVLGDVLAEIYGFRKTRAVIIMGFIASALAALVFYLVQILPPAADYANQESFEAVLGFVPRIIVASLTAYLVGQLTNAYVLVAIKKRFGEGRLWVRLLGSSVLGEAPDTLIFCTIAFYGVLVGGNFWNYVLVGFAYKMMFEVVLLPVSYGAIRFAQRNARRNEISGGTSGETSRERHVSD